MVTSVIFNTGSEEVMLFFKGNIKKFESDHFFPYKRAVWVLPKGAIKGVQNPLGVPSVGLAVIDPHVPGPLGKSHQRLLSLLCS